MKPSFILSVLFHPILMPLAGVFILLSYGGWLNMLPRDGKIYIYVVVGITTLILPIMMMPILMRTKIITSYLLKEQTERRIPYLIIALLYLVGAFILQKVDAPIIISLFLNGSSFNLGLQGFNLVSTEINFWFRVSII